MFLLDFFSPTTKIVQLKCQKLFHGATLKCFLNKLHYAGKTDVLLQFAVGQQLFHCSFSYIFRITIINTQICYSGLLSTQSSRVLIRGTLTYLRIANVRSFFDHFVTYPRSVDRFMQHNVTFSLPHL